MNTTGYRCVDISNFKKNGYWYSDATHIMDMDIDIRYGYDIIIDKKKIWIK